MLSGIVAKGYAQTQAIDYEEAITPLAKIEMIHLILSLTVSKWWYLQQMEGELEEEVYLQQPLGYEEQGNTKLMCRSQKALYGLKQVP